MDIQGYIIDHWMAKLTIDKPTLLVFDRDGFYHDLLPQVEERGVKVIDTTTNRLYARLQAQKYWANEMGEGKAGRMLIYRNNAVPEDKKWEEEPFAAFSKSGVVFPLGPQDNYQNICLTFLPNKKKEIEQLFANASASFNKINSLLEGAAYPNLEQLTGGKSTIEITTRLLALTDCADMVWTDEWKRFAEVQYPGLDPSGLTLREIQSKLWSYLLFSEFVFDLPETLPDNLNTVPHATDDMKQRVFDVCDGLRNQNNMREEYLRMSNKITEKLNLDTIFGKAKNLGNRVTFSFENIVEYNRFVTYLKEGKVNDARKLYNKNVKDVWYEVDADVANFWKLAEHLLTLFDCINKGVQQDGNLNDVINWYVETGYKADNAFRRFRTTLQDIINTSSLIKQLQEIIDTQYREFTERGVRSYQKHASEIKEITELRNQACVQKVYPELQEGKRVVLMFADAMRYEMGRSFTKSMEIYYEGRIKCEPRISYLPSVTRFGMANHLGNIISKDVNGELHPFIDDEQLSNPDERAAYLKAHTGVEVQDMLLSDFTPPSVNNNTQLLVIRSVGIDNAGENIRLGNGLSAMDRELRLLAKVVNECKRLGFDVVIICADHGYMLQPSFRVSDQISKPIGSDIIMEESRLLIGNINESPDTITFTPTELGTDVNALKMAYAKDFTVFTKGKIFYHEGLSLQENIVPIIEIQLQEKKNDTHFTVTLRYKGKNTGTVFTLRPLIDIEATFSDLFGATLHLKLNVTDGNGNEVGKPVSKFYNELTGLVDIPNGMTSGRQTIEINEDYEGTTLLVEAFDAETNVKLSSLTLNYEKD